MNTEHWFRETNWGLEASKSYDPEKEDEIKNHIGKYNNAEFLGEVCFEETLKKNMYLRGNKFKNEQAYSYAKFALYSMYATFRYNTSAH